VALEDEAGGVTALVGAEEWLETLLGPALELWGIPLEETLRMKVVKEALDDGGAEADTTALDDGMVLDDGIALDDGAALCEISLDGAAEDEVDTGLTVNEDEDSMVDVSVAESVVEGATLEVDKSTDEEMEDVDAATEELELAILDDVVGTF
jgi:hypothetical protein